MTAVMDSRPDYPPTDREFWHKASIRRGKVFDPWTKRWRTLLIPKQSLFQIWPEPSAASAGSEGGKAGPITKAKGGPQSTRNEIYQTIDWLLQLGRPVKDMAPMELAKSIAKERGKKLGERRWHPRTVLGHIQHWRAEH